MGLISSLFVLLILILDFEWTQIANQTFHRGTLSYFSTSNRTLYDWFFNERTASRTYMERESALSQAHPENSIVIFYIDKLTLNYAKERFHETFPWPRSRYVAILNDLNAAGARAVGLDLLFSDPRPEDVRLAEALENSGTVVASRFVYANDTIQGAEVPALSKFRTIQSGFVDFIPDSDHVVRKTILELPTRFLANPWSFDATLLQKGLNQRMSIGNRELLFEGSAFPITQGIFNARKPTAPLGVFLKEDIEPVYPTSVDINYTTPNHFTHHPIASLWNKTRAIRLSEIRNKIVLIGANAAEGPEIFGSDRFATPIGPMNGVELHAQIQNMFLEHRPIVDIHGLVFLVFAIGLVYGAALPLFSGWSRFVMGTLVIVAEFAIAYFAFRDHSVRLPLSSLVFASVIDFGSVSYYFHVLTRKEVETVRRLFEGYLSPQVVSTLLDEENRGKLQKQLSGQKQTATILYSDIRGFTEISERLRPEDVVALLNEYFPAMTAIVHRRGGYLDKFIGDAVMAVFSAPFPQDEDPWLAVQAGLEMQRAVAELGKRWEREGRPSFQIGIGINTGEVVLGNIGGERKKDYTVIGDSVNVASRLCAAATGGQILISEATHERVKDRVNVHSLGAIPVKGKTVPIQTYSLLETP